MKAVRIPHLGPPEVLADCEVPEMPLETGQVRLEVRASGVNFADLLQRLGLYGNAPKTPYVPGFEVSGEVVEAGPDCRYKVGDPLMALTRFGGYAERVVVSEAQARRIPEQLDPAQAAALPVNYLTAWFCLIEMGRVEPGEKVLIQGGAGGVGLAAIQLAKWKGADIYTTAGSDEKVRYLEKLGVERAINYRQTDFAEEIRSQLGKRPLDLVLDAVGGETLAKGYRLLAPLGRLVSYGLASAADTRRNWIRTFWAWFRTPRFDPLDLIQRNLGVYGFHLGLLDSRQDRVAGAFDRLLELLENEEIAPVVAERFALNAEGAAKAHRFLHDRKNIGKVLLVR